MSGEAEPGVLEYFPEQPNFGSSIEAWYVFVSPVFVTLGIAVFIGADWALPGGLLTALFVWSRRRRRRKIAHATFRLSGARLVVTLGTGRELLSVALDELENVRLDTKTIEKVQENMSSGMPQLRYLDSRVGPAIDTSRIELVTAHEVVVLTEHYTSNIDAMEWLAKIRRYLRKNGWQPADERAARAAAPIA